MDAGTVLDPLKKLTESPSSHPPRGCTRTPPEGGSQRCFKMFLLTTICTFPAQVIDVWRSPEEPGEASRGAFLFEEAESLAESEHTVSLPSAVIIFLYVTLKINVCDQWLRRQSRHQAIRRLLVRRRTLLLPPENVKTL